MYIYIINVNIVSCRNSFKKRRMNTSSSITQQHKEKCLSNYSHLPENDEASQQSAVGLGVIRIVNAQGVQSISYFVHNLYLSTKTDYEFARDSMGNLFAAT